MKTPTNSLPDIKNAPQYKADQVVTIAAAHFVHDVYTSFVAPLLPLIVEKLSLNLAMAGTLPAMMQFMGLLNPLIGYLDDRVGLHYLVIFAPAVSATLLSSMGLASSYWILAFVMVLAGINAAAFHAPAPPMVSRVSGRRVGMGMSLFMTGGELARAVGPLFAVWGVGMWGLEGIYRLMFIGWGASLLLYWRLRNVSGRREAPGSLRSASPEMIQLFVPLGIMIFLRQFLTVSLTTYLPIYMTQRGWNIVSAGHSLAWIEAAGVIGTLLSGTVSDRLGRRKVLLFLFGGSSLLAVLFVNATGIWIVVLLLLIGLTALSAGPIFLALVQDHLPNNRAVGNGIYLSLSFGLRALVMVLIGMGGDALGLDTTLTIGAGISLLAIPALFFLPKTEHREPQP